MNIFEDLLVARKNDKNRGLCSVCFSHPVVLDAALSFTAKYRHSVLIETNANQVNQHGGYTGMPPAEKEFERYRTEHPQAEEPALTFDLREALFRLARLEAELSENTGKPEEIVTIKQAMEALSHRTIPAQLLSQYVLYLDQDFLSGRIDIRRIPAAVVDSELARYEQACFHENIHHYRRRK